MKWVDVTDLKLEVCEVKGALWRHVSCWAQAGYHRWTPPKTITFHCFVSGQ